MSFKGEGVGVGGEGLGVRGSRVDLYICCAVQREVLLLFIFFAGDC